jgi:hypothetical protein
MTMVASAVESLPNVLTRLVEHVNDHRSSQNYRPARTIDISSPALGKTPRISATAFRFWPLLTLALLNYIPFPNAHTQAIAIFGIFRIHIYFSNCSTVSISTPIC